MNPNPFFYIGSTFLSVIVVWQAYTIHNDEMFETKFAKAAQEVIRDHVSREIFLQQSLQKCTIRFPKPNDHIKT